MTDREKIIKWFSFCREEGGCSADCPYWDGNYSVRGCMAQLTKDVLALLKEQENKIKSLEQTIEDICCG